MLCLPFSYYLVLAVLSAIAVGLGLHAIPFGMFLIGFGSLCLSAVPAYVVGLYALKMPRIVDLKCRSCHWSARLIVDHNGRVISDDYEA